jgi:protein SMG6
VFVWYSLTISDTGVKAILKDLYDKIKNLEQELTEIHRRMALDPEAGISILLDRPVDTYSREIRASEKDTSAWLDLIEKHK